MWCTGVAKSESDAAEGEVFTLGADGSARRVERPKSVAKVWGKCVAPKAQHMTQHAKHAKACDVRTRRQ